MATHPDRPSPPEADAEKPEPHRARVLVVDDYVDNCELYAEYLDIAGFEVATATDGQQAVESARDQLPDAILMDLSLPLMDGWQAIRLLKQDPLTRNIKVVALSGHAMPSHEQRAREAGCDGFIAKPCLPETVEDHLRALLKAEKKP
jgi:CheY-like chemotaxis protein